MSPEERNELVEQIAQAVIEKLAKRERLNRLADMVVEEILKIQEQQMSADHSAKSFAATDTEKKGSR